MTVFQVLPEVISSEELLRLITLSEFVDMVEMFSADVPLRRIGIFFAAIATHVGPVGR